MVTKLIPNLNNPTVYFIMISKFLLMRRVIILPKKSLKKNFFKLKLLLHGTFLKKNQTISKNSGIFSRKSLTVPPRKLRFLRHQTVQAVIKTLNKDQTLKSLKPLAKIN